jgi:hypothetical protein
MILILRCRSQIPVAPMFDALLDAAVKGLVAAARTQLGWAVAEVAEEHMYVLGGILISGYTASTIMLDTTDGTWNEVVPMPKVCDYSPADVPWGAIYTSSADILPLWVYKNRLLSSNLIL